MVVAEIIVSQKQSAVTKNAYQTWSKRCTLFTVHVIYIL